jgi:hypothetical protein
MLFFVIVRLKDKVYTKLVYNINKNRFSVCAEKTHVRGAKDINSGNERELKKFTTFCLKLL